MIKGTLISESESRSYLNGQTDVLGNLLAYITEHHIKYKGTLRASSMTQEDMIELVDTLNRSSQHILKTLQTQNN